MKYISTGWRVHERQLTAEGTGIDWIRHQDRSVVGLQARHVAEGVSGLAAIHVSVRTQTRCNSHSGSIGERKD